GRPARAEPGPRRADRPPGRPAAARGRRREAAGRPPRRGERAAAATARLPAGPGTEVWGPGRQARRARRGPRGPPRRRRPARVGRGTPVGHAACVVRRAGDPAWTMIPGSGENGAWTADDETLARRLRDALAARAPESEWRPLAEALARQRLGPIEPLLKGVRRV